ncbi:MAG: cation diffusion facilitator family transporter [Planctomycetota bacterium]|jgi:ferrous-iron efflux pump FieF
MEPSTDQPGDRHPREGHAGVGHAAVTSQERAVLQRDRQLRGRAAKASVSVAGILVVAKVVASVLTGSVALLASLVDSLSDLAASGLTLLSVRHASRPPDADHRFGHGKAEALSSLVQATLIAGSAIFVVNEAWHSLRDSTPVESTAVGIGVMLLALVLTGALVLYQRHVVRETGSVAIEGDSAHYRTDFISAIAVIVALGIEHATGWSWLDPAVGVVIAVYLVLTALSVGRNAIDELMDRELADEERERIETEVLAIPEVLGMHDLRTRSAGGHTFIELHIELDPDMRLRDSHHVAEAVSDRLHASFPGCEIALHQDPAGVDEPRLDDVVARTESGAVPDAVTPRAPRAPHRRGAPPEAQKRSAPTDG